MTRTSAEYSPEVRARAERMVLDHRADHPSHRAEQRRWERPMQAVGAGQVVPHVK